MKSHTEYLTFNTKKKREYINITARVEDALRNSNIMEGFCLVSAMHITAGVFINDDEPGIHKDIDEWLHRLTPEGHDYEHHKTGEHNGDAHLKNILVGHQVMVPVTEGRLDLGTWQRIFYAEFDGRRPKKLIIKLIGE